MLGSRLLVEFTSDAAAGTVVIPAAAAVMNYAVGSVVQATISAIKEFQMNLKIGARQGRIHISEANFDAKLLEAKKGQPTVSPFSRFQVGQTVSALVLGQHKAATHKTLAITGKGKESNKYDIIDCTLRNVVTPLVTFATLIPGQRVVGYVHDIEEDFLWLNVTPSIRGRVFRLQASNSISVVKDLVESFKLAQPINCYVIAANTKYFVHSHSRYTPISTIFSAPFSLAQSRKSISLIYNIQAPLRWISL